MQPYWGSSGLSRLQQILRLSTFQWITVVFNQKSSPHSLAPNSCFFVTPMVCCFPPFIWRHKKKTSKYWFRRKPTKNGFQTKTDKLSFVVEKMFSSYNCLIPPVLPCMLATLIAVHCFRFWLPIPKTPRYCGFFIIIPRSNQPYVGHWSKPKIQLFHCTSCP